MTPSTISALINISQVGSVAHTCLASRQHGKVIAVLSKAIYLLTDTNVLFWIANEDTPTHPRGVTIASALPRPEVGAPFNIQHQRLIIDFALTFDAKDASTWNAPRLDQNRILEITGLFPYLKVFFFSLDYSQAKGFGNFIPQILAPLQPPSVTSAFESVDPILLYAQPFVMGLARACVERNTFRISENVKTLIGLGSGLTPSGDDFVGGLLFALHILQTAYPNSRPLNHNISIEAFSSRTNLISFTLLQDLADGHAVAPLHQIANGLLSGEKFEGIYPFVSQLTELGNSTGWDMLTGLLTGFCISHHWYRDIPPGKPKG